MLHTSERTETDEHKKNWRAQVQRKNDEVKNDGKNDGKNDEFKTDEFKTDECKTDERSLEDVSKESQEPQERGRREDSCYRGNSSLINAPLTNT